MVTAEEIAQIALFASLDRAHCERLSRIAADISLAPGEVRRRPGTANARCSRCSRARLEPSNTSTELRVPSASSGTRATSSGEVPDRPRHRLPGRLPRRPPLSPAACPGRSGWSEPDARQRPERPSRRSMLRNPPRQAEQQRGVPVVSRAIEKITSHAPGLQLPHLPTAATSDRRSGRPLAGCDRLVARVRFRCAEASTRPGEAPALRGFRDARHSLG